MLTNIGKKIEKMRKEKGFSQTYLAKQLGISRPTFDLIEKRTRDLSISQARELAKLFSMTLEDFLAGEEPPETKVILEKRKKQPKAKVSKIRISVPQENIEKFKEVLLYVLQEVGAKPNIGETALYKLLYFIDFDFYEKYEEQLIGATYIKNKYGPTPVEFENIVKDMERKKEVEKIKSKYFTREQKKYIPLRRPNLTKLKDARELNHINDVLARFSDKNAKELTEYSHQDIPWITAKVGQPLEYEAVFYRTHKTSVRNYDEDKL